MIKMQVFLREDQKVALKAMAVWTGARESELVRHGVDLMLVEKAKAKADWKNAMLSVAGIWKDKDLTFLQENREATKKRFARLYDKD
jgi:hypothetical protein